MAARLDAATIQLTLTFRRDCSYCCDEPGCHLSLCTEKGWERVRQELEAAGIELPPKLELNLKTVVEPGALFFDFSRPDPARRGWYAFAPATGHESQQRLVEG